MNPTDTIRSHRIHHDHGYATLEGCNAEGYHSVIGGAYSDEPEYGALLDLAAKVDGMTLDDAQKAWHETQVRLIRESVPA